VGERDNLVSFTDDGDVSTVNKVFKEAYTVLYVELYTFLLLIKLTPKI